MTKKQLAKLVTQSYHRNTLDLGKVLAIAKMLNRSELKKYIKALKNWERKITVAISLPYLPQKNEEKVFAKLFPEKKLVYNLDTSLILGLKIINDDEVFEMSLKDNFNCLLSHLKNENDQ